MPREHEFAVSSMLSSPAESVWRHATTPSGVNAELMPLVRMTWPAEVERLTPETITLGTRLFRSWILLLGVLPIDYDDLTVVELGPGFRFLERSTMLTQRLWQHERTIEDRGNGCCVTDRIRFVPRVGILGPVQGLMFRLAFRLRHRNLRRLFGSSGDV